MLLQALRETAVITGGIMLILGAAALLGLILTRAHVSRDVAEFLTRVSDNPWVFMILVNILLLILGCLIDATAIILVTVPVLLPIAIDFGIDPIYFGVVMIINLMIGLLTPPVGSVLYITSSVTGQPVDVVFRGIAPFLIPLIAVLVVVTAFPDMVAVASAAARILTLTDFMRKRWTAVRRPEVGGEETCTTSQLGWRRIAAALALPLSLGSRRRLLDREQHLRRRRRRESRR